MRNDSMTREERAEKRKVGDKEMKYLRKKESRRGKLVQPSPFLLRNLSSATVW